MGIFGGKKKNILSPEQIAVQKNKAVAQKWIPVLDINDDLLYLKDGSIVGFIKVQPLNMDLLSKKEQRRKIKSLTEVYNGITCGQQTLTIARPVDLDGYIYRLQEKRDKEEVPIKRKIIDQDIKRAIMMSSGGEAVERQFYIIISSKNNKDDMDEEQLLRTLNEIAQELKGASLSGRVCDNQMIRDLQFLFGNSAQSSVERAPLDNGPYIQGFYKGGESSEEFTEESGFGGEEFEQSEEK
ncbi:hypothetical protein P9Z80_13750 [Bacillus cereus]|nr:hypothetical protein [Bacillus cereus]MEC3260915.1 hypothetical protein [Bacillus cereus]